MSLNDVCQPVSVALGENDTQQRESGCDAPRLKEERVGTATFTATLTSSSKRKLSPMNDQAPSRLKSILQRKGTSCNDADFSQAREGLGEIVNEDNNEHGECEPNRFRDENREIFRKCLLQGMEVALGMALSTLTENHCAIQAMLLEDILFEEFQDTPAAYRSQSCLLQTYLSDCEQCPLVCARVLLEKIDLRDLIFMTPMNLKEHAEVAAQDQHGEEVSNGTVGKCLNEASENNEGDNNSKVQAASTKERLMSLATMQATNDMRSLPITTAESLPSFSSGVRCISLGTSRSMLEVMEADGDGLMHDKLSSSPNQMQANTNGDNEFVDGSDHDDSNELQFSPQVALPDEYDHKHEEEDKMLKRQRRANARSKKYIKLRNGYKHFKIKISGIVFHTFLVYDTYLASPSYRVGEILSKVCHTSSQLRFPPCNKKCHHNISLSATCYSLYSL